MGQALSFASFTGAAKKKQVVFQLGTNNWQRQGEFAPGSGILHEAHHDCMNSLDNTTCYSVYPSKGQKQSQLAAEEQTFVRIFPLEHDIPICESISPVSSYRWHSMSEEEFTAYRNRLRDFCIAFIDEIEAKEGQSITHAVAHHSFLNPIILADINEKRVESGKDAIPFSVFVHGTALKMFHAELKGDNKNEFPMRFTPLVRKVDALSKAFNVFIISEAERGKLLSVYEGMKTPIVLSPNGVNTKIFKPLATSRSEVLGKLKTFHYEGSGESPKSLPTEFSHMIVFVGKFADWKRLDCLLTAASQYEKMIAETGGKVCTVIAGSGPLDAQKLYMNMARDLKLSNTFFIGPQPQPVLTSLYSVADVGVFPSYEEPMGMVFIECMACGTPVIGANSGGPRDFVKPEVGALIPECPSLDVDKDKFSKNLASTIFSALTENGGWKSKKGPAAFALATAEYSTRTQVCAMVKSWGFST